MTYEEIFKSEERTIDNIHLIHLHYGRYVDDFYIVSQNKNFLHKIIPLIEFFLEDKLKLKINKRNIINDVKSR